MLLLSLCNRTTVPNLYLYDLCFENIVQEEIFFGPIVPTMGGALVLLQRVPGHKHLITEVARNGDALQMVRLNVSFDVCPRSLFSTNLANLVKSPTSPVQIGFLALFHH